MSFNLEIDKSEAKLIIKELKGNSIFTQNLKNKLEKYILIREESKRDRDEFIKNEIVRFARIDKVRFTAMDFLHNYRDIDVLQTEIEQYLEQLVVESYLRVEYDNSNKYYLWHTRKKSDLYEREIMFEEIVFKFLQLEPEKMFIPNYILKKIGFSCSWQNRDKLKVMAMKYKEEKYQDKFNLYLYYDAVTKVFYYSLSKDLLTPINPNLRLRYFSGKRLEL